MPVRLYDSANGNDNKKPSYGIVTGIVSNNCDLVMQGKVYVRIPSIGDEVWARLIGMGAGAGRGDFVVPPPGTEVLLAMSQDDPNDAFLIGGLWSTVSGPPISIPTDMQTKRVIRTGISPKAGVPPPIGHEIELDDLTQSVTITTSTKQKITLGPKSIEISALFGAMSITLDAQGISISALSPAGSISLNAATIKLLAGTIDIQGTLKTSLTAGGICTIGGNLVKIN